jgi:hypothetical protein
MTAISAATKPRAVGWCAFRVKYPVVDLARKRADLVLIEVLVAQTVELCIAITHECAVVYV